MKRIGIVVLIAMLAILSACGGRAPSATTPAPQKQATLVQDQQASPTEAADAEPTEAPAAVPTVASVSNDQAGVTSNLELTDEAAALKNLKSYKSSWSVQWSGKQQDGTEQTIKWLSAESYTSDPQATYTKFESSDSSQPAQSGTMEFYQIGAKSYMVTQQDGKPQCTAFTSDDNKPSPSLLDRSAFGSISNGTLVGTETINGVRAKHYKYDEKATGVKFFSKLTGDVWVAEDGGYVVKDVAEWEGNLFGMLSGGSSTDIGKGSWTQEVTDINQPFQITPPEGCENAAEGLPMMDDATEKTSFGALTTYKTASKLADVAKFYQDEMAKAGWTAEGDGAISEQFGTLSFTKDGKKASVVLTGDGTSTSVMITVE
jgi:hypothetical protein